ncbi:MAG: glycosyl hydrolase 108 family protein, partial [Bacteroidota bacterium]
QSLARVRIAEGGYQVHPNDPGNYNSLGELVGTNHGINAQVYESHIGQPPSRKDMASMIWDTAANIYRQKYWNAIQGDQIKNQALADIIFDGRVNHGAGIRLLQEVLGVTVDGIVGPKTLREINSADPARLYNDYKERRRKYYHALVEQNPRLGVFLNGWMNRLARFNDYYPQSAGSSGLSLAGGAFAIIFFLIKFKS